MNIFAFALPLWRLLWLPAVVSLAICLTPSRCCDGQPLTDAVEQEPTESTQPENEAPVEVAEPEIPADWDHLSPAIVKAMKDNDFKRLETIAAALRKEPLQVFPDKPELGKLELFYDLLPVPLPGLFFRIPVHDKLLAWRKEFPDSPTPRLALAAHHLRLAWAARGPGLAAAITPEGLKAMKENVSLARTELEAAEKLGVADPDVYRQMFEVAQLQGWPREETMAVYDRLMKTSPTYFPAHTVLAQLLMPRWGGAPNELESYAEDTAAKIGGNEGDEIYARIVQKIAYFHPRAAIFSRTNFEYPRVQTGLKSLGDRFPDDTTIMNQAAFLAAIARDQAAAKQWFERLQAAEARWPQSLWTGREQFDQARAWALADSAPREDEQLVWPAHDKKVEQVFWTADGEQIVTIGDDPLVPSFTRRRICIWDAATGQFLTELPMPEVIRFHDAATSADGELLAAAVTHRNAETQEFETLICLWNLATRQGPYVLEVPDQKWNRMALASDGQQIALAAESEAETGLIHLIDLTTGKSRDFELGKQTPTSLRFTSGGDHLLVETHGLPITVNCTSGKVAPLALAKVLWEVLSTDAPGGETVLALCRDRRSIVFWDFANQKQLGSIPVPTQVEAAAFTPDGRRMVTTHRSGPGVIVWDVAGKRKIWESKVGKASAAALSPAGTRFAHAEEETGRLRVWDLSKVAPLE